MNLKSVAVCACAIVTSNPLRAHVIYSTGFEPGQCNPGPLVGQDSWMGTTLPEGWRVMAGSAPVGAHHIIYEATTGAEAMGERTTGHIQLEPMPGMSALRLEALVRVRGLRTDAMSSLHLMTVHEVPDGLLNIGIVNGQIIGTSGLPGSPTVAGPMVPVNQWFHMVAELDMITGEVVFRLDDAPIGGFMLDMQTVMSFEHADGITLHAMVTGGSTPATETFEVDSLRLWHTPAPGAIPIAAIACLCAARRHRETVARSARGAG
jgi:hypothetical protein